MLISKSGNTLKKLSCHLQVVFGRENSNADLPGQRELYLKIFFPIIFRQTATHQLTLTSVSAAQPLRTPEDLCL